MIGTHFRLYEDLKAMDKPFLQQSSPLTSRRTLFSVDRKDGIYSWIIALGLCLINCIDDGVLKGFGVLLNPLSLQYGVATWVIGATLALMGFVGNIIGNLLALSHYNTSSPFLCICYPLYFFCSKYTANTIISGIIGHLRSYSPWEAAILAT